MKQPLRVLLPLLLALSACDLPQDDNPSVIRGLRILGVSANPPEVTAAEELTLDSLVVDPSNREITYSWSICLPLLLGEFDPELGAFFGAGDCAEAANLQPVGEGKSLTLNLPSEASISGSVPFILQVRAGDASHIALKRVSLNPQPARTNPQITSMRIDGSDPEPGQAGVTSSTGTIVGTFVTDDDGDSPTVEFFVSAGAIECGELVSRSCNISFTPPYELLWNTPRGTLDATIYAVARDGLGGVSWASRQARVSP